MTIVANTDPHVITPKAPIAHTQYQFTLKVSSKDSPAKFPDVVSQTYTLIFGCPQGYTDIDPS